MKMWLTSGTSGTYDTYAGFFFDAVFLVVMKINAGVPSFAGHHGAAADKWRRWPPQTANGAAGCLQEMRLGSDLRRLFTDQAVGAPAQLSEWPGS